MLGNVMAAFLGTAMSSLSLNLEWLVSKKLIFTITMRLIKIHIVLKA